MHYTVTDGNLYSIAQPQFTNTDTVIHNISDPSSLAFQYNLNPNAPITPTTPTTPGGFGTPKGSDFSPRANKRAERDEPLEEGLVMHIREAFLPFNDPSPTTRASKRYVLCSTMQVEVFG